MMDMQKDLMKAQIYKANFNIRCQYGDKYENIFNYKKRK